MAIGDQSGCLRGTRLTAKIGTNFPDKRRSLGQYSFLADSGHGASFLFCKTGYYLNIEMEE
jgi:hypothetical protein